MRQDETANARINAWAEGMTARGRALAGRVGSSSQPLTDINSAAVDRLRALSGIGVHYAKKIVDGRPYRHPDELVKRKILPQHAYALVKDRVVARSL